MNTIFTVTELTKQIKELIESTFGFLWISGEISNLRRPGSGHAYFTLKDSGSQIRAVIFRHSLGKIGFPLEDGMHVLCRGALTLYQPRGEYQIIVDTVEPKGVGALQRAFEQLKLLLAQEGLFDPSHKKTLPFLPHRIGIVTSPTGAAIRDILTVSKRRFPAVGFLITPVRVQGEEAPAEICNAIAALHSIPDIDVIIVARGGGSLEDLYPFNHESVARAIHASRIPVVSAVGHEVDYTIADFVADLRAPTPSAAAELVVPDRRELAGRLRLDTRRLLRSHRGSLDASRERIRFFSSHLKDPRRKMADLRLDIDGRFSHLQEALLKGIQGHKNELASHYEKLLYLSPSVKIQERRFRIESASKHIRFQEGFMLGRLSDILQKNVSMLDSLNPLAVLKRGYGIVRKMPEQAIVSGVQSLSEGATVSVRLESGSFEAKVSRIIKE